MNPVSVVAGVGGRQTDRVVVAREVDEEFQSAQDQETQKQSGHPETNRDSLEELLHLLNVVRPLSRQVYIPCRF